MRQRDSYHRQMQSWLKEGVSKELQISEVRENGKRRLQEKGSIQ
jgi:hypothetical protein